MASRFRREAPGEAAQLASPVEAIPVVGVAKHDDLQGVLELCPSDSPQE
jgi:hypothetical protein